MAFFLQKICIVKNFLLSLHKISKYLIMAQLHNGNLHCLRRTGKNGKQIALYVTKNDVPKIYTVHVYKRINPNELTMKLDMEFVFGTYSDAKNKYNEYAAHL